MSQKTQTISILFLGGVAAVALAAHTGTDFNLRSLGQEIRSTFTPACTRPITYAVATYDERFGMSRAEFDAVLAEAAALWNEAAGKTVVAAAPDGEVKVHMVYGELQQVAELGQVISAEQSAYQAKKAELEGLRAAYVGARQRYLALVGAFEAASRAYEADVAYWNDRGGAPPGTYEELNEQRRELERQQARVNAQASEVNAIAKRLNTEIDALNRLAAATNQKVNAFNHVAGSDFDQGTYIADAEGKRINIFEFTDELELKRVLAHEFGHALGIGHVENPESIMYSYNVGEEFALSAEDIAALKSICGE